MKHLCLALLLTAGGACKGDDQAHETGVDTDCGDIDGVGPVPNVLGRWTTNFAVKLFDENCNLAGLDQDSEYWLTSALTIEGWVPIGLEGTLSSDSSIKYTGAVSPGGGLVLTGERASSHGKMFVSMSGLVYRDPYLDRDVWQGLVYIGLDTTEDDGIDCDIRGDWKAFKSGS